MAELTARNLIGKGIKKIYVANRHFDKAQALAEQFNGQAVGFREAMRKANDVDIVVTSTGRTALCSKAMGNSTFHVAPPK